MILSPHPGVDWLSGPSSAPGSGVSITRQRGVSLVASTRSSPSGTSMSIIVEFEVEGGLHVAKADDARRGVVLPSHSPQFLRVRRGSSSAGSGSHRMAHLTDTFLAISPILQQQPEGGRTCAQGVQRPTFILVAAWEQSLHPGGPGQRLAHRKGPLNAENAVRTTGLLTAGRNPGDRTDPSASR